MGASPCRFRGASIDVRLMVKLTLCGRTIEYRPLTARTPDGLEISVQDHGDSGNGRDVLFIHGFSQSSLAWLKQVSGPLKNRNRLVTYDMRGHGASDKPTDPSSYREAGRWAGEVSSVIDAARLNKPVIVCWSYGGRVALDFLRHEGDTAISGLVKVAATSCARADVFGPATPLLRAMASASDLAENVAATRNLLDVSTAEPLSNDEQALMLAYNLLTPPAIRLAMSGREANYDDILSGLQVPLLTIHGAKDSINLPAMSKHSRSLAPCSQMLVYDKSGHMPFWEEADRFNADLASFLDAPNDDATHAGARGN